MKTVEPQFVQWVGPVPDNETVEVIFNSRKIVFKKSMRFGGRLVAHIDRGSLRYFLMKFGANARPIDPKDEDIARVDFFRNLCENGVEVLAFMSNPDSFAELPEDVLEASKKLRIEFERVAMKLVRGVEKERAAPKPDPAKESIETLDKTT